MSEAILALYSQNSWSYFHSTRTKRNLHWIIQVVASIFAIVGTLLLYVGRKRHFMTIHSLTGANPSLYFDRFFSDFHIERFTFTGLISLILLVITCVNGISALWAYELSKIFKVKAVYSKLFHNVCGIAAFAIGEFSIIYSSSRKRKTMVVPSINSFSIRAANVRNELTSFFSLNEALPVLIHCSVCVCKEKNRLKINRWSFHVEIIDEQKNSSPHLCLLMHWLMPAMDRFALGSDSLCRKLWKCKKFRLFFKEFRCFIWNSNFSEFHVDSISIAEFSFVENIFLTFLNEISKIFFVLFVIFVTKRHISLYFSPLLGMVSLYYGYLYAYFNQAPDDDMRPWLIRVLFLTTFLSLVGAFKALYSQLKTTFRL